MSNNCKMRLNEIKSSLFKLLRSSLLDSSIFDLNNKPCLRLFLYVISLKSLQRNKSENKELKKLKMQENL